jgi:hypothetical protein
MFGPRRKGPDPLDITIQALLADMEGEIPSSAKYGELLTRLERLYELRNKKRRVSPDTIWQVAGSLGAVLVIVAYEQRHVFVSRAQAFIPKIK